MRALKALKEAATVFKKTFRTSDVVARLGEDEFAALTVDITEENSDISRLRCSLCLTHETIRKTGDTDFQSGV